MIGLRFSMLWEDIIKHTHGKYAKSLHFSLQEVDILYPTNVNCHFCIIQSICRTLCNIDIHLITNLNVLMPRY